MRILSRYLLARFAFNFAATLFVATSIVVVVELLLNLDRMGPFEPGSHRADGAERRLGPLGIAIYLALRLPSEYLSYLVPISGFLAAFLSIGMAAHWRETLAAKAGGRPLRAIAGPMLAAGALLSLISFLAAELIVVPSTRAFLERKRGLDDLEFSRDAVWVHKGHRIYTVDEADEAERVLRGVQIFERGAAGKLERSIEAERAQVGEHGAWTLERAVVRDFRGRGPAQPPRLQRYAQLAIDMGSGDDALHYSDSLQMLPLMRLRDWIERREASGDSTYAARTVIHGRLAAAASAFLLVAFALPFALRVERGSGFGRPAVWAIAGLVLYYALTTVTTVLSAQGVLNAAIGAWGPVALFGALTALALARADR